MRDISIFSTLSTPTASVSVIHAHTPRFHDFEGKSEIVHGRPDTEGKIDRNVKKEDENYTPRTKRDTKSKRLVFFRVERKNRNKNGNKFKTACMKLFL